MFTAILNAENQRKSYAEIAQIAGVVLMEKLLRDAFVNEGYHGRSARKKTMYQLNQEK